MRHLAKKHMLLWVILIHHLHIALAQIPATLPATVPKYLTMWTGSEDNPVTTFEWSVPHKFYRISKIEVAVTDDGAKSWLPGFRVTFQPCHPDVTGWPDEV